MAILYDFPLDLLDEPANVLILKTAKTVGSVLAGYKTYAIHCPSASSKKAVEMVRMMDFFASVGVCSRMTVQSTFLACKDGTTIPNYKILNGFANFPLDAFLGQIEAVLKSKKESPQIAVVAKTTSPDKQPEKVVEKCLISNEIKVSVSGSVNVVKTTDYIPVQFYFQYHKAKTVAEKDFLLAQRLLVIYERARSRSLDCNLTINDLKGLFRRKTCYYTGVTFDEKITSLNPTVDRINPNLGYVSGNVALCSNWSNSFKAEVLESQNSRFRTTPKILEKFTKALSKSKFQERVYK